MTFNVSKLTVQKVLILSILLCLCQFVLESPNLPDYEAYQKMYLDPDAFSGLSIFFTAVLSGLSLVFGYENTRIILFLLGFLFYSYLFLRCEKSYNFIILAFFILLILFEFNMIRLRAGLSILLFFSGVLAWRSSYNKFLVYFLWVLSFSTHPSTFIILLLVQMPSIVPLRLTRNIVFCYLLLWLALFYFGFLGSAERGEHLNSNINPARMLLLVFIPLVFYLVWEKFSLRFVEQRLGPEFFSFLLSCLALLILYFTGLFAEAGEAIIRIFSLVIGPSLLFGLLCSSKYWSVSSIRVAQLAIFGNSLFFINTVYL